MIIYFTRGLLSSHLKLCLLQIGGHLGILPYQNLAHLAPTLIGLWLEWNSRMRLLLLSLLNLLLLSLKNHVLIIFGIVDLFRIFLVIAIIVVVGQLLLLLLLVRVLILVLAMGATTVLLLL